MFKIVQMKIESNNVEASTNALPFDKRMLFLRAFQVKIKKVKYVK